MKNQAAAFTLADRVTESGATGPTATGAVTFYRTADPVTFQGFGLAMRALKIELVGAEWDERGARLDVIVPDRNTGQPIALSFHREWDVVEPELRFPPRLYDKVRAFVTEIVAHEVMELLLVNGLRIDPHVEEHHLARVQTPAKAAAVVFDVAIDQNGVTAVTPTQLPLANPPPATKVLV